MTLETARQISRWIVLGPTLAVAAALPLVLAWDLYADLRFGRGATISHFVYESSQRRPWPVYAVALALAYLFCHFFVGRETP